MATQESIDNLVQHYKNLIIAQYQTKPKAMATMDMLLRYFIFNNVLLDIQNAYNVDTAMGKQLDYIGNIVGVDRKYIKKIFKPNNYFIAISNLITNPDNLQNYRGAVSNGLIKGKILSVSDLIANELLPDDTFRILIKLKIILNNSDFSYKSITDSLFNFFQLQILLLSDQNMEIVYLVSQNLSLIAEVAVQKKLLPKPAGVKITMIKNYNIPYFVATSKLVDINKFNFKYIAGAVSNTLVNGKILSKTDYII